jgi:aspartate/methionine/tyrosine aminotransferase
MSDTAETLNLQEVIARIDRAQAETEKFVAEQRKLIAESLKLDRDRVIMPWQVVTTLGAGAALFAAGAGFIKIISP